MGTSFLSVAGSIVTVAIMVVAVRWLLDAKGSQLPRARDGTSVYGIKWQWRVVGLGGAVFWVVVSIWSWHDLHSRPDGVLIAITAVFVVIGLWIGNGSVTTNQSGITKSTFWSSRSFQWRDINEIRLHEKQGGAVELRSGSRKLIIDSRFDAFRHLLGEIEDRTQLEPIKPGTTTIG